MNKIQELKKTLINELQLSEQLYQFAMEALKVIYKEDQYLAINILNDMISRGYVCEFECFQHQIKNLKDQIDEEEGEEENE